MIKRRIIAWIMTVVMILTAIPMSAFAEKNGDYSTEDMGVVSNCNMLDNESEVVAQSLDDMLIEDYAPMLLSAGAEENNSVERYTVLVLDTSSSSNFSVNGQVIYTANTAVSYVKSAAKKFLEGVLKSKGNNHIAIVSYKSTASTLLDFSSDLDGLNGAIDRISASDTARSIAEGLYRASSLLENVEGDVIKNVVLFTTGMTNAGSYSYSGKYDESTVGSAWYRSDTDVNLYAYANVAYDSAKSLADEGVNVYSIGLFQTMDDMPEQGKEVVELFKLTARDIASSSDKYYEVTDVNNLEFIFGEVAEDVVDEVKTAKFVFPGTYNKAQEATCVYTDKYFFKDAKEYDPSLATMSLCFELSSWSAEEKNTRWTTDLQAQNAKWIHAKQLLVDELGFENFSVNDFWEAKPTKDSIGAVAASKELSDGTVLVALAVRGGGYEQEWSSNFTVGIKDDHKGFAEARDNVIKFLETYLREHKIEGAIKLWLVGYSRAAITANMVAGKINDGYILNNNHENGKAAVAKSDFYVYTFEAPQGVLKEHVKKGNYANIHNVINRNDFVPLVAPYSWGFTRYYNKIEWLPSAAQYSGNFANAKKEMNKYFTSFSNNTESAISEYSNQYGVKIHLSKILPGGDPFVEVTEHKISTEQMLNNSSTFLFDGVIGNRQTYYNNLQAGVREILSLIYGGSITDLASDGMSLNEFLDRFFSKLTIERILEIVKPAFALNLDSIETRKAKVNKNIETFVTEVIEDSDLWGTVKFVAGLKTTLTETLQNLLSSAVDDIIKNKGDSLQSVVNLIMYVARGSLAEAHIPETTLSWMMSRDSNYTGSPNSVNPVGSYRIVHINCPVDVTVYNDAGKIVANLVNGQKISGEDEEIIYYVDVNNEKVFILSSDESYRVVVKATDNGTVNISLGEYDLESYSYTRLDNYYDITVVNNQFMELIIPKMDEQMISEAIPNGSDTEYRLIMDNGSTRMPDEVLTGDEAAVRYAISVNSANKFGFVNGGGLFAKGSFCEVEATPVSGSEFIGWYNDGNLVSKQSNYRFAVTNDMELIAVFEEVETYTLDVNATVGGTVENIPLVVTEGTEVNLLARADEGFEFDHWETNIGKIESIADADTWITVAKGDTNVTAVFKKSTCKEHVAEVLVGKDPTCTETGFSEGAVCKVCGIELVHQEVLPATGHHFENGICKVCNMADPNYVIDEPVHKHSPSVPVKENIVNATCTKAGSYEKVIYCSICKEELSRTRVTTKKIGHRWDYGVITEKSTYTCTGKLVYTCQCCKKTKTVTIPKLPRISIKKCMIKIFQSKEKGFVVNVYYCNKKLDSKYYEVSYGKLVKGKNITVRVQGLDKFQGTTTKCVRVEYDF